MDIEEAMEKADAIDPDLDLVPSDASAVTTAVDMRNDLITRYQRGLSHRLVQLVDYLMVQRTIRCNSLF